MTEQELNKYKTLLTEKQEELNTALQNRDAIGIEKNPDALDEVQHAAERELAIRHLDREWNLFRNVQAALQRIEDKSFGVCQHCEEDISPRRLAAVPWSPYCIRCQEKADRHRENSGGVEMLTELTTSAA